MRALAIGASLILSVATAAFAEPLSGSALPQNSHWVVHVDVDGVRNAKPLWDILRLTLLESRRSEAGVRLSTFERITGMKLLEDLHDVTLYGSDFDEGSACVRIHGKIDKEGFTAFLAQAKDFIRGKYNGHDVFQWHDDSHNGLVYLAFPGNDLAILGPSRKTIETALDLADGKAPALKTDSPLSPPAETAARPAPFIWIAADGLASGLSGNKVESPLILPMESASLAVRWSSDRLSADARVRARNAESAQQLQAVAEGIKAFVALSAESRSTDPRARVLAEALAPMKVQADGNVLKGEWSIDKEAIWKLINLTAADPAATKPATKPLP